MVVDFTSKLWYDIIKLRLNLMGGIKMFQVMQEIGEEYLILFNGTFQECQEYVKENKLTLSDTLFIS